VTDIVLRGYSLTATQEADERKQG